ncbi:hypothetical protein [Labrys monachus]|uniref:Uncharacterized protein n=1 Tax=Labrys monachus TaxID=217067 RepID=A0ABU0FC76_9HYPH|nr:hypothetical protein [Labrys monachus]MDQ0392218.1 hypothetical protein [Labrys monachus]
MLKRLAILPLQILVALLVVIDELARPLYRPLVGWFQSLRIVEIGERFVARLPRFVILALLAVPIAIAEPLKIYSLLLIGEGRPIRGILLLALAHLASFLLIERIYEAGKPKLMTIGWLALLLGFVARIRAWLLDWVKCTPAWRLVAATRQWVAGLIAALRAR